MKNTSLVKRAKFPKKRMLAEGRCLNMTVCIAAICGFREERLILACADRALTMGDATFEPTRGTLADNSKIWIVSNHAALLMAGDMSSQMEIKRDMVSALKKNPSIWQSSIQGLAEFYAESFRTLKKKKPNEQGELAAIITGIDESGAHIYSFGNHFTNLHPIYLNSPGFHSIGSGSEHAEGHLKRCAHNPSMHYQETIIRVHEAKKRAEIARDVGRETDMFLLTPKGKITFPESFIARLDAMYENRRQQDSNLETKDAIEVVLSMRSYFDPNAKAGEDPKYG